MNNAKGIRAAIGFDIWKTRLPLNRKDLVRQVETKALLAQSPQTLFPKARHPQAALAGILLFGGCWSESHEVAQDLPDAEGSYWHALIHRMEPDFFNSQYWFRRVTAHAIYPELHQKAASLLTEATVFQWSLGSDWNPMQFNRWIEETETSQPQLRELATSLHTLEARLLLAWCCEPRKR